MSAAQLETRVAEIGYWYHRIELPGGVVTPGWAPRHPERYGLPDDLTGERVLDVGAWDGYWTFEALRRGAAQVVAIDDFSDHLGFLEAGQRVGWQGFDLCRDALGYGADRCQRRDMSVYEVDEATLGRFDRVLCFGLLYHLRYPLLGLDRLAALCDHEILVESAILDDFSPYRGGLGHGYPGDQMLLELYPEAQYGNNPGNWFVPTLVCLGQLLRVAGFDEVSVWRLSDDPPTDLRDCRGFGRGIKSNGP